VRKAIYKVATGGIWIKKRFADALLQATFTENTPMDRWITASGA